MPVEVPAALESMTDEDPVVGCPVGDDHVLAGVCLGSVLLEPVRDGEDDHLQGDRVLRAELRDGSFREVRDLLAELLQQPDRGDPRQVRILAYLVPVDAYAVDVQRV